MGAYNFYPKEINTQSIGLEYNYEKSVYEFADHAD
jgi:hypothetical protein